MKKTQSANPLPLEGGVQLVPTPGLWVKPPADHVWNAYGVLLPSRPDAEAGHLPRACLTTLGHSIFSFLGTQSVCLLSAAFPGHIVTQHCDISGSGESPVDILLLTSTTFPPGHKLSGDEDHVLCDLVSSYSTKFEKHCAIDREQVNPAE